MADISWDPLLGHVVDVSDGGPWSYGSHTSVPMIWIGCEDDYTNLSTYGNQIFVSGDMLDGWAQLGIGTSNRPDNIEFSGSIRAQIHIYDEMADTQYGDAFDFSEMNGAIPWEINIREEYEARMESLLLPDTMYAWEWEWPGSPTDASAMSLEVLWWHDLGNNEFRFDNTLEDVVKVSTYVD